MKEHSRLSAGRIFKTFNHILVIVIILSVMYLSTPPVPARADVAPPESPPGTNLVPGNETTQVRMMAETVTLDVQKKNAGNWLGQAKVTAVFQMRNLGSVEEKMDARFPLSYWNGYSDGFGNFPEITDLNVFVNNRYVETHRITTDNPSSIYSNTIPWAAFPVTFIPGKDVQIKVTYTANGFGEYSFVAFKYILETGAGWYDTIGSADLIVRLPYEANNQNVIFDDSTGFSMTTPGSQIVGNEIRWHYDNLEPTRGDNLEVTLITPEAWEKVLKERGAVKQNPGDGEAWGQLGKACKEIIVYRKAMREDEGGKALYQESLAAYEKAVTLLPSDSLWHYGFADLLWEYYFWYVNAANRSDFSKLTRIINELKTSLDLDPNNSRAFEMLQEINGSVPDVLNIEGNIVDYLILTATPAVATPTEIVAPSTETLAPPPTETPTQKPTLVPTAVAMATLESSSTSQPASQATAVATSVPTTKAPGSSRLPLCGGTLLLPVLFLALFHKFPRIITDHVN
jgi:hypothetical protein